MAKQQRARGRARFTGNDYVEIRRAHDGQHYALRRAGNHRILSVTETYTRRPDAVRAARRQFRGVRIKEAGC